MTGGFDDLGKKRYLALQRAARATGRPTDELMSIYALEGFLSRLSNSDYASRLVLKGGMLLAAFIERRPTRDIDLQALDVANDAETIRAIVKDVALIDHEDGLRFDVETSSAEVIREDDDYSGVRVSMDVRLNTARLRLRVDVNVGDPIWPAPIEIEIPSVLEGTSPIRVIGYSLPTVLAEKLITAISRGPASTRWRDFADVVLLTSTNEIHGGELQKALGIVAQHRQVEMLPLQVVLKGYATDAQNRWQRWVARQGIGERVALEFNQVLEHIFLFADPAIKGSVADSIWIPRVGWTDR